MYSKVQWSTKAIDHKNIVHMHNNTEKDIIYFIDFNVLFIVILIEVLM